MPREAQGVPGPQEVHGVLEHVESTHDPDDKKCLPRAIQNASTSYKTTRVGLFLLFLNGR